MSDKKRLLEMKRDSEFSGELSTFIVQMKEVRTKLLEQLEDLTDEILDFTPDIHKIETIGTLLLHIADVENSWIFENIDGEEIDLEKWKYAFPLRQTLDPPQLTGKNLEYYLGILEQTRGRIVERLKAFSDKDLKNMYENTWGK